MQIHLQTKKSETTYCTHNVHHLICIAAEPGDIIVIETGKAMFEITARENHFKVINQSSEGLEESEEK